MIGDEVEITPIGTINKKQKGKAIITQSSQSFA
jgi:hypothetical protein